MTAKAGPRPLNLIVDSLREALPALREKRVLAGFDGFIDTIAKPVKSSGGASGRGYFDTIGEFGAFISGHSHKSTSVQYEILERKRGGNMPNFTAALDALGLRTTAVGMLSGPQGAIDPLFGTLGEKRLSYLEAGSAMAFEFEDGKVFFSPAGIPEREESEKMFSRIEKAFPDFVSAAAEADLTAFLNWSELSFAEELWEDIYLHCFDSAGVRKDRVAFFDLCDTGAKSPGEVEALASLLRKIGTRRKTVLSLNENEALDILAKIRDSGPNREKVPPLSGTADGAGENAEKLRRVFALDELVIHRHSGSAACSAAGESADEKGVYNKAPKISTGAGDHFNAAYCFAALADLPLAEKLRFANAFSGAYVERGASPGLEDIDTRI